MPETIVLASASPFRRKMLEDAGLAVEAVPAEIDERAVETAVEGSGVTPQELAA
ncbi:MAG TPA: Maf family protein, partial [Aquamicrobium sp.]|nr:Maf family protein [Aquamicrobium sp.]